MDKTDAWQAMTKNVDNITDGIGHKVDAGIKDLVIACNLLGLNTVASCEGHLDWATGGPYVDFGSPNQTAFAKQYDELEKQMGIVDKHGNFMADEKLKDKYFSSSEFSSIRQQEDRANAVVYKKVLSYLHKFYESKPRLPDIFIQLNGFRVESEGAVLVPGMTKIEKRKFLQQSQLEFQQFTKFLKQQL